jgi:multidrug resistance efflux pump
MTALLSNHKVHLTGLLLVAVLAAVVFFMRPHGDNVANGATMPEHSDDEGGESAILAKVIQPKYDPNFTISVTQPAYVDSYNRAELRARVAGPVLVVTKAMDSRVKKGEELIKIDVPDLVQDVARKEAVVAQRKREVGVARAFLARAMEDIKIAAADIDEKKADVREADATTAFRKQELARFEGLARDDKAITENIVEERRKFYEAAAAGGARARAAVVKAQAAKCGAEAKSKEAEADVLLKEALVEVAVQDVKLARAMLGFATLTAPFDGVVTRRNVDPGTFVQNSAGSPGPALLTIEQTEMVTIYSNIPDNYAPYIDDKTEAVIEMSELPGVEMRGQVTRRSPSLQTPGQDRTMRVEVDLYNRGPKQYRDFLNSAKATKNRDLKDGKLPVFPQVSSKLREKLGLTRLMPGMYGTMKLILRNFHGAYLIPSQAVFTKGGKSYIFVVKDDKAHLVSVDIQVDDGILAKIVVVEGNRRQSRRELTAEERIILCNQGELSDGQTINASLVSW